MRQPPLSTLLGDFEPCPENFNLAAPLGSPYCPAIHPEGSFLCTRLASHAGDHIAHGTQNQICSIWDESFLTDQSSKNYETHI